MSAQFPNVSVSASLTALTIRYVDPKDLICVENDPQTHEWSLRWANGKDGTVVPPQVGEFKDGRGEFYGQDTLNGRLIYIRFVWTKTDTDMPHFEQSFSDDGGKTWEVNWLPINHGSVMREGTLPENPRGELGGWRRAQFPDVAVSTSSTALTMRTLTDGKIGANAQMSLSRRS